MCDDFESLNPFSTLPIFLSLYFCTSGRQRERKQPIDSKQYARVELYPTYDADIANTHTNSANWRFMNMNASAIGLYNLDNAGWLEKAW